jgi:hypothetical protein
MNYSCTLNRWLGQKKFTLRTRACHRAECFISYNKYSSFSSMDIINYHLFLEKVCGQKPFFFRKQSGYVGSTKYHSVTSKVSLRKRALRKLLSYLGTVVVPLDIRHNGLRSVVKVENNRVTVSFNNWDIFQGVPRLMSQEKSTFRICFYGDPLLLEDYLLLYKIL